MKKDLEYWGDTKIKITSEGLDYYLQNWASDSEFLHDEEVQEAFCKARDWLNIFEELIDKRISDLGGDPEEYTI